MRGGKSWQKKKKMCLGIDELEWVLRSLAFYLARPSDSV